MEQRPDSPDPAVLSAGTDPTHIPGLDTVVVEPEKTAAAEPGEPAAPDEPDDDAAAGGQPAEEHSEAPGTGDADRGEETPPEGPAFKVLDHRSSIAADGAGVVFRLDETEAHFSWEEIGAVEIGASRFGRRFEVTVCTTDRRRFDAEVIAPSKKRIEEWTADLDTVLDAWFEDGSPGQ